MARIAVVGGGIVGLSASLMLARDGHEVTVLERDPAPPPEPGGAWDGWERRGVNQFRLLHFLQPRYRAVMQANVPEVVAALADAGALLINPCRDAPVEVTGGFRDGDERHDALTARRPVAEAAVARVVAATDGIEVRRGAGIAGLLTGDPTAAGVPHVVGVRTEAGDEVLADLVVDAAGRRSTLPTWLTDVGAPAPVEERADCGFVYYGRHFRSNDGSVPPAFGGLLQEYGTISVLTLPADNGTWGVGLIASSHDTALRAFKDVDAWTRVVKSLPLSRALARRRTARRPCRGHGQDRRPAPHVRGRRPAGRDRCRRVGRLVGVYESIRRPGDLDRRDPRGRVARPVARHARRSRRAATAVARGDVDQCRAVVPGHPRVRRGPPRPDRRVARRSSLRADTRDRDDEGAAGRGRQGPRDAAARSSSSSACSPCPKRCSPGLDASSGPSSSAVDGATSTSPARAARSSSRSWRPERQVTSSGGMTRWTDRTSSDRGGCQTARSSKLHA